MAILSSTEITQAQTLIDNTPIGVRELKKIYGSNWKTINSPTTFGKKFKETVNQGLLKNIKFDDTQGDNHACYEIF
jgi:hypothetical protein